MTDQRASVLTEVERFIQQKGYSPTVREIAELRGLSVAGVYAHLRRLRAEGHLDWVEGAPRTMRVTKS